MKLFLLKKKKKDDTYQTDFFNFIILKKGHFQFKKKLVKKYEISR